MSKNDTLPLLDSSDLSTVSTVLQADLSPLFKIAQSLGELLLKKKKFNKYLFIYLLAIPFSIWDLSSLTRNQTHVPYSGSTES